MALVYFLFAHISLAFVVQPGGVAAVYPPCGILLASLLLTSSRRWPLLAAFVLLADFVAERMAGNSWALSWYFALVIVAEGLTLASLLRLACGGRPDVTRLKHIILLMTLGPLLVNPLVAFLAMAPELMDGAVDAEFHWRLWWISDATGVLIMTPLILAWVAARPAFKAFRVSPRVLEASLLVGGLLATAHLTFGAIPTDLGAQFPYLTFPFVLWAALRFGAVGVTSASAVLSAIAVWCTVNGLGPFAGVPVSHPYEGVFVAQIFVSVTVASYLILAVIFTERTQALRASHDSRRLLQEVTDNSTTVIYVKDERNCYAHINRRFEEMFGVTRRQATSLTDRDIFPPETSEVLMQHDLEVRASGRAQTFEESLLQGDEVHTYVSVKFPLRGADDRVVGVCGISTDITDRKRIEQELARLLESETSARLKAENLYEEAQRLHRMKDEFLLTLSHELRTPLTAIVGWSEMLLKGDRSPNRLDLGLGVIVRNAAAQQRLIDDLLDSSSIVAGNFRLEMAATELASIFEAAIDSVRPTAQSKNVRVEGEYDASIGLINCDPRRMQQVLWNLLVNAVKFTPAGGHIHVRARRERSKLVLTVTDTGIGLRADVLPYIFDRFRQADSSTTRAFGGLGLGLAIVRDIVELHGGMVAAASAGEGAGATFTITLPIAAVRLKPHAAPAGEESPGERLLEGLRVLAVDDDADALDVVALILRRAGAEVKEAASASEALNLLSLEPIDLVVSDLAMPEMDGFDFVRRLRSMLRGSGKTLPVVALTACVGEDIRKLTAEAGYQAHITKPIEPSQLVAAIAQAARSHVDLR